MCDSVTCFCSYRKQTQPLPNLWQPKEQYLLICTGSENRKGPLEHRALSQMVISSRKNKILSYFSKFKAFYLYVTFTTTHLFCVSCGQILIARSHKVMVGFTRVSFTFEVGGILKTLLGFFAVCFGGCR